MSKRIQSVIELAKYRIGDMAYWVSIRPLEQMPELEDEDLWMTEYHPKVLYTRGPAKKMWPYRAKLPKLHHVDFEDVVELLTSEFVIEQFEICNIVRSNDTGEFLYSNDDDEWMVENDLFDTNTAATKEKNRIKNMIRRWAS